MIAAVLYQHSCSFAGRLPCLLFTAVCSHGPSSALTVCGVASCGVGMCMRVLVLVGTYVLLLYCHVTVQALSEQAC
jgi:hypothetical protein